MSRRHFCSALTILAGIVVAHPGRALAAAAPAKPTAVRTITVDDLRSLAWRSIGPANMGGRISEICLIPGQPHAAFVATATGGLFRTSNGGTTWSPVFDDQDIASIGSVAVAPSDSQIIYVGTGEGNGRNSSSWGDGIYKSTDGGGTFTKLGLADSRDIPRLAVHPRDPNIVYAAVMGHLWDANAERGLYRTGDGGKTWKPILQFDRDHGCIDVALDPRNPEVIYAAMYARRRTAWSFQSGGFGDRGGIYKSGDGGRSFHRLTNGLPAKTGRIGLALAGDSNHVYAVVESDAAGARDLDQQLSKAGGVFRSLDGGAHWERMNALAPRGFYFSKIVVDPRDENRIYVLGFGLGVSDDGGRTFASNGADLPHGDLHTLVIDPRDSAHLWLGTDGGIYESLDRSKTWIYHDNLALGEFYELSLGMDEPYTICGGLQDNGCWCGPSRGRVFFGEGQGASGKKVMNSGIADWSFIWGGDGYYTAIDPRNPDIRYAESQQGYAGRVDLGSGRIKYLRPTAKEGQPTLRFNWNSPMVLSRFDPDILYLGGNQLFRIHNPDGASEAISPDLSARDVNKIITGGSGAENHGTIVTLSESPLQRGLLWAGTDDGRVWMTRDDGKIWSEGTSGLAKLVPKGTYVSRIEASHFEAGAALASFDGHRTGDNHPYLMETRDSGKSWRKVTGDLPEGGPVRVVREDLANPQLLFAGTEFGAFVSFDRGGRWLPLRPKGFPTVQFHDLQIHSRDRDLVAGTHGRSIYVLDDITGLEQLTPEVLRKPVALLKPRPALGYYMRPRGGMWGNNQYGAKSPPPQATLNYWVRERDRDGAKITVKDSLGHLVRELEGPAEAGLNRITWDLARDREQRYDPPESERTGQFVFVPEGTYQVELTVGKEKSAAKLVVTLAPGVGAP